MIRKAVKSDTMSIAQAYDELLTYELENGGFSNWRLHVYPTIKVPQEKIPSGTMYVLDENNNICASMVLNHDQAPEYKPIKWNTDASRDEVLVIHTLCIPPKLAKHGYGKQMVEFAKEYAKNINCRAIRIDTYAHNEPAKRLYLNNGFHIVGYGNIVLQGLIPEEQVYLEYEIE